MIMPIVCDVMWSDVVDQIILMRREANYVIQKLLFKNILFLLTFFSFKVHANELIRSNDEEYGHGDHDGDGEEGAVTTLGLWWQSLQINNIVISLVLWMTIYVTTMTMAMTRWDDDCDVFVLRVRKCEWHYDDFKHECVNSAVHVCVWYLCIACFYTVLCTWSYDVMGKEMDKPRESDIADMQWTASQRSRWWWRHSNRIANNNISTLSPLTKAHHLHHHDHHRRCINENITSLCRHSQHIGFSCNRTGDQVNSFILYILSLNDAMHIMYSNHIINYSN